MDHEMQPNLSQTTEKDHEDRGADMVTPNDDQHTPLVRTRREGHHLEATLHHLDAAAAGDAVCLGTNQETEPPSRVTTPLNPLVGIALVFRK